MKKDELKEKEVQDAWTLIHNASRIALLTHMSPDGDALGSALGMRHWLEALNDGRRREVSVIVPNTYPSFLSWMPGAKEIAVYDTPAGKEQADIALAQADLFLCTDFNEPKRVGILSDRLSDRNGAGKPILLIDHHLFPGDWADVTISYPDSPSASELVYRLIRRIEATEGTDPLPQKSAVCLYTGMMTDTGNFSFNSNRADMYDIVGELVRSGVDKDAVYNAVYNAWSADRMRLVGYCLYNKMRLFPEHHTALICLSRKDLYRFNFKSGDAEGIVNMPLQIKDIYYSCFMREDKEVMQDDSKRTKIKLSFRSQGEERPVNTMAHELFNGGGHTNAAGGEYYGPLKEAEALFVENYAKYFIES